MMRYGKANVRTYIIASLSFPFHLLDRCLPMERFRYPRGSDKHDRVSQTKQNLTTFSLLGVTPPHTH